MKSCIIGFGRSGAAAMKLLKKSGVTEFGIFDDKMPDCPNIADFPGGCNLTVVSPGVDRRKYPNIPKIVLSEIELAYKALRAGAKVVVVTGTNGKSTVTHVTAQILNNAGMHAVACGNIGLPFGEVVTNPDYDVFVVELSSFQIELLNEFTIDACAVTNVTPDHLDRYTDFDEYAAAKLRILDFMNDESVLVALDDALIQESAESGSYRKLFLNDSIEGTLLTEGTILNRGAYWFDVAKYPLFGKHNLMNLVMSLELVNAVTPLTGDVTRLIEHVTGMPHRTEVVGRYCGVTYINDSKATNVDSTLVALASCNEPTVLILGGKDKKGDFIRLAADINRTVSQVVLVGEAREVIRKQLDGRISVEMVDIQSLEDAVAHIAATVKGPATVLFSPGCASFDAFDNFEHRGQMFAKYVKASAGEHCAEHA